MSIKKKVIGAVVTVALVAALVVVTLKQTKLSLTQGSVFFGDSESDDMIYGFSKSGSSVVYGRTINWTAKGYLQGFTWKYKADATDVASGVSGHASGLKSGEGAVKHAIEDCFKAMVSRGVITPPPSLSDDLDAVEADFNAESGVESDGDSMDLAAGLFSKSGNTVVYTRNFRWKVSGGLKGLHWRYKADATDVASGVTGHSSGLKSGEGAVKHAIEDCFKQLIARGIITPPPKLDELVDVQLNAWIATEEAQAEEDDSVAGGKSGSSVVYGRTIRWTVKAYLQGFTLKYKADATDAASGVGGHASGLKSGEGAVKHAIEDCFKQLIARGIVAPPPSIAPDAIPGEDIPDFDEEDDEDSSSGLFSKEGDTSVAGRNIHYKVTGYLKWFSWKYKADARDQASGVTGHADGKASGQGAVEWAIKDLFNQLIARGIVTPPPQLDDNVRDEVSSLVATQQMNDDIAADVADAGLEEADNLASGSSKSGSSNVYGRTINWTVKGYLQGFTLKYKADATDVASGVSGHASGLKSGEGAVKHAIEDCFNQLIARGIVTPAPQASEEDEAEGTLADLQEYEATQGAPLRVSEVVVNNRKIKLRVRTYFRFTQSFSACNATDVVSSVSSRARAKKPEAATQSAIQLLFKKLADAGIVASN